MQSEKDKLLSLNKILSARVKGQNEALDFVANAILRSKADISDPGRPIGSFIFMGPTGVGKTEVAKTLAEELFDSEKHMVRLDMSEYMEAHSVARLIGSPPGYVGYDEGGQLTEAVRRNPYTIVLFDEIEKAHPKVLDALLQVLDEGTLTDGKGKEVNFKNTIIILTTNIGAMDILENKDEEKIKANLFAYLRPEFINRIDEIIIFKPLDENVINAITVNELSKVTKRLSEQQITITFSKEVVEKISKDAYDPQFGARPIKKYISKNIETPLAKAIIGGELKHEESYLAVIKNNKIDFVKAKLN